jgi:hypothetical protein
VLEVHIHGFILKGDSSCIEVAAILTIVIVNY